MNAAPLINRAISSANANLSSTESLAQRVTRLEAMMLNRQSRAMASPAPSPAAVKAYAKLDVEQMRKEAIAKAEKTAANIRALEKKIIDRVSGRVAA